MSFPNSQSPPRQHTTLSHESPVHAKKVHSSRSYQNGLLDDARLAVLEDLGSRIPEITLQAFIDFLAPPQPDFNIEATMEMLKSDGEGILTASGRWTAYEKEPKDQTGKEDAIFKPMPDIFKKIVDSIIANSSFNLTSRDCSTDFLQNPTMAPMSADRHNATRPDGYLLVKDRIQGETVSWADVVLSCEYKCKDGNEQLDDDVRKCLWSMQHVMRDDPCRRATFGMTVENATTRVWFCCRSSVIVSEAFNFITQPEALVKLFAAFAFADKTSLGFDPTIERVPGVPMQFIITMYPNNDKKNLRRFRTTKIISSYGAEPLRGRGTRVFEVIEIDAHDREKGLPVVLKDIWIDHDRTREGDILAQLYDQADDDDKKLVEKHFLTTICHGDVWTESDVRDDTENTLMRGLKVTTDHDFELQRKQLVLEKHEAATGSEGLRATSRLHVPHPHLKYAHKTHYRIVFKEEGITVDLIPRLPDVMIILTGTVTALQLLRKLGWVHRDVSIGNILSYQGEAKLADLEYAKRVGEVKSHEMRTGTMHFMSIEVAEQEYLFRPPLPHPGASFTEIMQGIQQTDTRNATSKTQDEPAAVLFSHNHLHDLESLWWVAVWMVFYNHLSKSQQSDECLSTNIRDVDHQLGLARILFPPVLESSRRQNGFQLSFTKRCEALPINKKIICGYLEGLRQILVKHYLAIESTFPQFINSSTSKDDIYDDFRTAFIDSRQKYSDFVLAFIPDVKRNLKRARTESTNDTGVITKRK